MALAGAEPGSAANHFILVWKWNERAFDDLRQAHHSTRLE